MRIVGQKVALRVSQRLVPVLFVFQGKGSLFKAFIASKQSFREGLCLFAYFFKTRVYLKRF